MKIQERYLTKNPFSRPGTLLKSVKGVVLHWVANPMTTANQNRNYFESLKDQKTTYAGAHYIIGLEGEIIQCFPDNEVGYHVGANLYKERAIRELSTYPNNCTIGIELCHTNWNGEFAEATLLSAKELILGLCAKYNLGRGNVYRHYDITGKDCPRFFVQQEHQWEQFLNFVFS